MWRFIATVADMGTEIAIPFFGPLIAIGTVVLLYIAISGRRRTITGASAFDLGRSCIALGYLGVLVALVAYCYVDTAELSRTKIARGDVTAAEASQYFFGWFLNIFCLETPFVIFFVTVLGLPLLSSLRRIRFASVLGVMITSQLLAAAMLLTAVCRLSTQRMESLRHTSVFCVELPIQCSSRWHGDRRLYNGGSTAVVA